MASPPSYTAEERAARAEYAARVKDLTRRVRVLFARGPCPGALVVQRQWRTRGGGAPIIAPRVYLYTSEGELFEAPLPDGWPDLAQEIGEKLYDGWHPL